MNVYVCTAKQAVKRYFAPLERARTVRCTFLQPEELEEFLSDSPPECIVYIDISAVAETVWRQKLKAAGRTGSSVRFGIVDPSEEIADAAGLFHRGACDYLNRHTLQTGVCTKRVKEIYEFQPADVEETGAVQKNWTLVPGGWKDIKSGSEYTFSILYVRLDMIHEWKKKSGQSHINAVQKNFHNHIENVFTPVGGKIWMWMNDAGLVIFPFDGKNCVPLLPAIRTVLNRDITSIDLYNYNSLITYTMALHIGNTEYKSRGKTGGIISETVNFIFHLAKHCAKPGHLYLTDTVRPFVPPGLEDLFIKNGSFEGTVLYSMRLPKGNE